MFGIFKKFIKYIKGFEKVDCYTIDIVINCKNTDRAIMSKQIRIPHGSYPKPRKIKKTFEKEIQKIILDNEFYHATVFIKFNCHIGTFRKNRML